MQLECIMWPGVEPLVNGTMARQSAGRDEMVEAIVWAAVPAAFIALMSGIRRLPWRWCVLVGLGFGIVWWAVRLATIDPDPSLPVLADPGILVYIGAFGGGLAQFAFDRGERAQQRRSGAILGSPPA